MTPETSTSQHEIITMSAPVKGGLITRTYEPVEELPVNLDELFDPIWEDEIPTARTLMSEWDKQYQKSIDGMSTRHVPTEEQNIELAELIQRGKKADSALDIVDSKTLSTGETKILREQSEKGAAALETLFRSHLRLASWFVRQTMDFNKNQRLKDGETGPHGKITKYLTDLSGGELDYSDRMQIAIEALWTTATEYTGFTQEGNKISFAGSALWKMESALLREMTKLSAQFPINAPIDSTAKIKHLRIARDRLSADGVENPTHEDIASFLEQPVDKVAEVDVRESRMQRISWEVLLEFVSGKLVDDEDPRFIDVSGEGLGLDDLLVHGGSNITVEDEGIEWLLDKDIDDVIASVLDEREQIIIELRNGLDTGHRMTLEEVGQVINVTRERVRQLEARAMSKIRRDVKNSKLQSDQTPRDEADPQFGLRPLVKLNDSDDAFLNIQRPSYTRSSSSRSLTRYSGSRKAFTLKEFEEMKDKA